jgi:hypothetical protein
MSTRSIPEQANISSDISPARSPFARCTSLSLAPLARSPVSEGPNRASEDPLPYLGSDFRDRWRNGGDRW